MNNKTIPQPNKNDLAIKHFKSLFGLDEFYRNELIISFDDSELNNTPKQTQQTQDDISNNILNRDMYSKNEKIQIFHLETLNHCKKETWNAAIKDAIKLDNSNNIVDFDNKNINTKEFSRFLFQLRTAMFGPLHFTGTSFSNHQIVMGDFYSYYIQYLAEIFFGNPQIVEPFKNSIEMRQTISQQLDIIFDKFTDVSNLFKKNEDTTIFSRIPYITDVGFVLSITIKVPPPNISGYELEDKKSLKQTYWVLHILLI